MKPARNFPGLENDWVGRLGVIAKGAELDDCKRHSTENFG